MLSRWRAIGSAWFPTRRAQLVAPKICVIEAMSNGEECNMLRDGSEQRHDDEWASNLGGNGGGNCHGERCDELHRTLKRIVKARAALDAKEAAALREAQALGLWRRYGCSSLIDYMEREMGYSPRAAIERLR